MKKELLSVLSLSLLISFAPSCKEEEKSKKPKTVKKIDVLNAKVLDVAYDDEDENRAFAQADTDNEDEEEIVTKF